ncbi:MAG: peptidoglycan binding domain-containing protein, partial [Caldilineales bacterium]|nr:peptidoglycan binding domain-containing protein [Caldilineales bacterium]
MKRRFWLLLLLVLVAVVYLGPPFMAFHRAREAIPAGMTLGGAVITGATSDEVVAQLRQLFESPILVYHGERRLVLRAEQIDFRVEAEAMVAEAQRYRRGLYTLREFLFYLLQRPPIGRDIPLRYSFDRDKLAAWLREQAAMYDNDPTPAYAKLDTLQFVPGRPGRYTDLADSAVRIIAAFGSAYNRQAHLSLHERPPLPPTPETLEEALRRRLERFNGIYSLYY